MFSLKKFIYKKQVKKALANCLYKLNEVQIALFNSYLKKDFLSKQPMYVKILHTRTSHFFRSLQHLEKLIKKDLNDSIFLSKIEKCHEVICSIHLLRFRVSEYNVFEICARELRSIEKSSTELLVRLAKSFLKTDVSLRDDDFLDAIHSFEAIYHHTLQIVVRDPIIFLFFIQDLYAFQEVVAEIYDEKNIS